MRGPGGVDDRPYARARAALIAGFTGIDDLCEVLESPDMEMDTAVVRPGLGVRRTFVKLERAPDRNRTG